MAIDNVTIKELFDIHLNPIKEDISDLKKGQNELIKIAKVQALQGAELVNIRKIVDNNTDIIQSMKEKTDDRLWEITKALAIGFAGAIFGKYF